MRSSTFFVLIVILSLARGLESADPTLTDHHKLLLISIDGLK